MGRFTEIYRELLGVIFPPRCPVCDGLLSPYEHLIHSDCQKKLIEIKQPVCLRCGKTVIAERHEYCDDCRRTVEDCRKYRKKDFYRQGKALFGYKGSIKETMYRFKYANRREYAAFFAETAVDKYAEWIRQCDIDVIVPVPMHKRKRRERGYNQAECFGRQLSKKTGIPMARWLVRRVKNTEPLKQLGYVERKKNLDGAFQVLDSIVKYDHILIVDDIYTTGSTIESIGHAIAKKGECSVYALCICTGQGK